MRYIHAFTETLRLRARLWAWAYRRRVLCPMGRHVWSYFGRERVCRACRLEEHRDAAGEWHPSAAVGWTVETPKWHNTEPQDHHE